MDMLYYGHKRTLSLSDGHVMTHGCLLLLFEGQAFKTVFQ